LARTIKIKNLKLKMKNYIFFALSFFFLFPIFASPILAEFSFKIENINPNSVSAKDQEVEVALSITNLPSESYFRVAWQEEEGSSYFGYDKNNNGNWVKIKSLSDDCTAYYKVSQTGNSQLTLLTKIGEEEGITSGVYLLRAHRFTTTCKSNEPSTNMMEIAVNLSTPTPTEAPVNTPTPIPTPTAMPTVSAPTSTPKPPTPTSTTSPTPLPTASFKINEVKNESGEALSTVKIYVDGKYTHHYAPETLKFCDGCYCYNGGEEKVSCGFGQHTFRLEKTGYNNWEKTETINAGGSYEVSPVMTVISAAPTSTPNPTATPTPTRIPTSAPTPTAKPLTPSPTTKLSPTSSSTPAVLGKEATGAGLYLLGEATAAATPTLTLEQNGEKRNLFPLVFIGLGGILILGSVFSFWYYKGYD
jgi:hypothetical protein